MHPSESAAVALILAVGAITLALSMLAYSAWRRTRNDKLLWVMTAFGLFAVKEASTAVALVTGRVAHEHLELVGSGFDLVIVALLILPFLIRA
jgi:hypothetical protein